MPNLAYVSASYLIYDSRIDAKFRFPAIEGCREIIIMDGREQTELTYSCSVFEYRRCIPVGKKRKTCKTTNH